MIFKNVFALNNSLYSNCNINLLSFSCGFKLFDQEGELNWVIFHDVLATARVYIRTVCPIRYEWVKDLLPKLHEVDAYELSSVAREEVTAEEMTKWESREAAKRQSGC